MTRLEQFGWRGAPEPGIARVISAHGDYYHLVADEAPGEILARKKKSAFRDRDAAANPITGDFVRFRYNAQGESLITDVLPRFSRYERRDPTARRKSQTLAVNFDAIFFLCPLDATFSRARLARYLDLADDMGEAEGVIVLSKCDLSPDPAAEAAAAALGDFGVRVLRVSSVTGEGLDAVREYARPQRTVALVGSSGVGKSSLVNALAGEDWMATQETQSWSGKGRHTTTSRELVLLPDGALVLDTPGIREIGRVGEEDDVLVKGESTHRFRRK